MIFNRLLFETHVNTKQMNTNWLVSDLHYECIYLEIFLNMSL